MTFRSDRIWRLGEKEKRGPALYRAPSVVHLRVAREDDPDTSGVFATRFEQGVSAVQLTSEAWHRHWWSL